MQRKFFLFQGQTLFGACLAMLILPSCDKKSPGGATFSSNADIKLISAGDCSKSLYEPRLPMTANDFWESDNRYEVSLTPSFRRDPSIQQDVSDIYISGDTLRINDATMPSLVRTMRTPNTKIGKIVFDARRIEVDGVLAFDTASVVLKAEVVSFGPHGQIIFTSNPALAGDGVEILADRLNMRDSKDLPFNFATGGWSKDAGGTRRVRIHASTLVLQDPTPKPSEMIGYFRNRTLDRFDDTAKTELSYDIAINAPDAGKEFRTWLETATWPDLFASKLVRQFNRAPYQEENQAYVLSLSKSYGARIPERSEDIVHPTLIAIRVAVANKTDLRGLNGHYVPRERFDQLLNKFEADLDAAFGPSGAADQGLVASWDRFISAGYDLKAPKREVLVPLEASLTSDLEDAETLARDIDTNRGEHQKLEERVKELLTALEVRDKELDDEVDRKKAQSKQAGDALAVGRGLAMVASVLPVSAPVGIALTASLSAAGEAVYRHNTGGGPIDASYAIATLPDTLKKAKELYSQGQEVRAKWRAVRTSFDQVTKEVKAGASFAKAKGKDDFSTALGEFAEQANSYRSRFDPPGETIISMEDIKKNDDKLQGLIRQLTEIRTAQADIDAHVAENERQFTALMSNVALNQAKRSSLLSASIQNDEQVQRMRALGLSSRRDLISEISTTAAMLRRAVVYHTGTPTKSSNDIAFYNDEDLLGAPVLKRTGVSLPALTASEAERLLRDRRLKDATIFRSYAEQLRRQADDYYSKRFNPVIKTRTYTWSPRDKTDTSKGFLSAVNTEISAQLADPKRRGTDKYLYVPLPPTRPGDNQPQKLIAAAVTSVEWENPTYVSGKQLDFAVTHPGFGSVNSGGQCYTADMRRDDAIDNKFTMPSTVSTSSQIDIRTLFPNDDLNQRYRYALRPLVTNYYVSVEVPNFPGKWTGTPQAKSLSISYAWLE